MAKKKTKPVQTAKPKSQGISWKVVGGILGGVTAFVGSVITWLDFIVHVQSGYQIFLWAGVVVFIVIWAIILWLLYKQRNNYGYIWLAVTLIAGVGVWYGWTSYVHAREEKLIVLIAKFDGPEEVYGLRNEIIEKLFADFPKNDIVQIETTEETITSEQGSTRAKEFGKKTQADLVIWGWYRPTENPNVTIHVENLTPNQILTLGDSETFHPLSTLAEMETFSFQQKVGQETSSLLSFLSGMVYFSISDFETAIERFDISLAKLPSDPMIVESQEIYFYRGNANSALGEHSKAISDFGLAIQITPEYSDAYNNRGFSYIQLGDYKNGVLDLNKSIQFDPKNIFAYNNRGNAYADKGEYQLAHADYNQAISINPKDVMAYHNLGTIYLEQGELDLALVEFDKAIEIAPELASTHNIRGVVYEALGNYQKALESYNLAIAISPLDTDAYFNRADLYADAGEINLALRDLNFVIQINSQDGGAFLSRGDLYYKLGDYQKALEDYNRAIQIDPQNSQAYNNRGNIFDELGFSQRAISDYDQAIRLNPQDSIAYYNRGITYQRLGKNAEAEADFAKYKELTGRDAP